MESREISLEEFTGIVRGIAQESTRMATSPDTPFPTIHKWETRTRRFQVYLDYLTRHSRLPQSPQVPTLNPQQKT